MLIDGYKVPESWQRLYPVPSWLKELSTSGGFVIAPSNNLDPNLLRYGNDSDSFEYVARFQAKVKVRGHSLRLSACARMLSLGLKMTPFGSSCFCVNASDKIMVLDTLQRGKDVRVAEPVYTANSGFTAWSKGVCASNDFAKLVAQLSLTRRESLHVYGNGLTLYMETGTPDVIFRRCDLLVDIGLALRPKDEGSSETGVSLPSSFSQFQQLYERWGIADDSERSELLEESSREELETLVATVFPEIKEINSYLARHRDESANALGCLAEAASDASIILSRDRRMNA